MELLQCLKALLRVEREWVPTKPGHSLYIRPFMFSSGDGRPYLWCCIGAMPCLWIACQCKGKSHSCLCRRDAANCTPWADHVVCSAVAGGPLLSHRCNGGPTRCHATGANHSLNEHKMLWQSCSKRTLTHSTA